MNRDGCIGRFFWRWILMIFVFIGMSVNLNAQNYKKVGDLKKKWKFSIGDKQEWADPNFDDSNWEWIDVPSAWENKGFYGYDGFAWYRTTFSINQLPDTHALYLQVGYIDDVHEVFVNGTRIGMTGKFPPQYSTAYNVFKTYKVPSDLIEEINTIAVRVYDDGGEGGIINGDIGLMIDLDAIPLDVDLSGSWKFKTGKYAHKSIAQMDSWDDIMVPGFWEDQGYKNYDGYACYALEFELDDAFLNERMVLALGKIDDIDQVYLNGVLIGQSGEFKPKTVSIRSNSYQQIRGYYLPQDLLKANEKNVLLVKVLDTMHGGGIYTGSIGLITQDHYIRYWNNRRGKSRN